MVMELPLSQNLVALVDDIDYDLALAAGKWSLATCDGKRYARRRFRIGNLDIDVFLHSFLTGWRRVDHINSNGLDNRRANLRPATPSENSRNTIRPANNTSGYKGVGLHASSGLWRAAIHVQGRQMSLKYHHTPEAAARAYDSAAREHFGEFARLNFPNEGEQAA